MSNNKGNKNIHGNRAHQINKANKGGMAFDLKDKFKTDTKIVDVEIIEEEMEMEIELKEEPDTTYTPKNENIVVATTSEEMTSEDKELEAKNERANLFDKSVGRVILGSTNSAFDYSEKVKYSAFGRKINDMMEKPRLHKNNAVFNLKHGLRMAKWKLTHM